MMTDDEILRLANWCRLSSTYYYAASNKDLITFARVIEQLAYERAAQVCEGSNHYEARNCAAAIRNLK